MFLTRAQILTQNDTMDVLDDRQNGAPPMDVDDLVSVNDRKLSLFCGITRVTP